MQSALGLVEQTYPSTRMRVVPDAQGGAWVEMFDVPFGAPYVHAASFFIFLLPFNLPGVDIYPFFVRPDFARIDGAGMGPAFQSTQLSWPGDSTPRPVIQVSRRTRGSFGAQTASQKLAKVFDWMAAQ